MSKVFTFAGTLLLVLVIGTTTSNSGTASKLTEPQGTIVPTPKSFASLSQAFINFKGKLIKLKLPTEKDPIQLYVLDAVADHVWLAKNWNANGSIVPAYFIPLSNINYVLDEGPLTRQGTQGITIFVK